MKRIALIVTLVVLITAFLGADVYIKQIQKTGAFMGQQAKEVTNEIWLGNNKMATNSPEMSMVMDVAGKKIFLISHANKTYVETDLPLDMTKLMPAQLAGMMKGMTVTIQPNGQTKKVGNWNAKGFDFNMTMMGMNMKMTMWASKDVPFDWKKYSDMSGELYKAIFKGGESFIKEFEKMDGYPVASEMSMIGANVEMTTVEISEKSPGAGVYSVPAGYTKTDKLSMGGMR